jgi:ribosomal-protein-alanine N-acetyltransferase
VDPRSAADDDRVAQGQPERAFELLRNAWDQGIAKEAAAAVLERARSSGHERVWATVREWNTASLRVSAKIGFVVTDRVERDELYGDTVFATRFL